MINLPQLRAIIHYETLLQWRSRSWYVVAFGTVVLVILSLGLSGIIRLDRPMFSRESITLTPVYKAIYDPSRNEVMREAVMVLDPEIILNGRDIATITDAEIEQINATIIAFFTLWFSMMILMFATPVFMTEVIPRDQQYNVRPVLDSTPLTLTTYLTGKVLSVWLNLGKIMLITLVICAVVSWGLFGAFDVTLYLLACVAAFIPACLFAGALGVLVPAAATTRRRAMLVGILLLPLVGYAYFLAISDLWGLTLIAQPLLHFAPIPNRGMSNSQLSTLAAQAYAKGLVALILSAVLAWGLLKQQIQRA